MLSFEINNVTSFRIDSGLVRRISEAFFKSSGLKGGWNYSLVFVGEKRIRAINRDFRGKDKVTDVLSFEEEPRDFGGIQEEGFLGEIIICPSRAKSQARKYGWSFNAELQRLLVHGLSHLLGHDHENVSPAKARRMAQFEEKVAAALAKSRAGKRPNWGKRRH